MLRRHALPAVLAFLAAVTAVTGCDEGGPAEGPRTSARFADCAALTEPPGPPPSGAAGAVAGQADRAAGGGGDPAVGRTLPTLALPCAAGGADVDLAGLRGPAVVNLWASWCPPCRRELPVLQRFAERERGRVHVVGVVSNDDRSAAGALAEEFGLTFPHLYDREGRLMRALARPGLPVTVFVDGSGRVRHVYAADALDQPTLDGLARRHLGLEAP
jgi:thiol-disulfide isomerase/thioredoxin